MSTPTTPKAAKPAAADTEKLFDFQQRQKRLNALEKPTIYDMCAIGVLVSFAGRLSDPFGAWHCPRCWMDYASRGQYTYSQATRS